MLCNMQHNSTKSWYKKFAYHVKVMKIKLRWTIWPLISHVIVFTQFHTSASSDLICLPSFTYTCFCSYPYPWPTSVPTHAPFSLYLPILLCYNCLLISLSHLCTTPLFIFLCPLSPLHLPPQSSPTSREQFPLPHICFFFHNYLLFPHLRFPTSAPPIL